MNKDGHCQEETEGPIHSFCWGEEYMEDDDAEPWQADLRMPDSAAIEGFNVILTRSGRSREEAVTNIHKAIPAAVLDYKQDTLAILEVNGSKIRFMEGVLGHDPIEQPAFGVLGTFLYIPREIGGPDIDGFDHIFRVKGRGDFRVCMEDLDVVIATDYAILYDEGGKRRLDYPRRAQTVIDALKEK